MTIQLTQVYINNVYKDDIYVTITNDTELEGLLYFKFYNNVNSITIELLQPARKEVIRKIMLMEFINKVVYTNANGIKEEVLSNRKLVVKRNDDEEKDLVSDDTIIKFQKILDITPDGIVVIQNPKILTYELLDILEINDAQFIRIMDYEKSQYTIMEIRSMFTKVKLYVNLANKYTSEMEKFTELYSSLYKDISVDATSASKGNIFDIICNKTSITGYAEILKYILDEIHIENKLIVGKLEDGNIHYWNQVNLNYIWYNVDMALDAKRYIEGKNPQYFLVGDEFFYKTHVALSENIEICPQNSPYVVIENTKKAENFFVKFVKKLKKLIFRDNVKRLAAGEQEK